MFNGGGFPLSFHSVEPPNGGWCKSGHYAREIFTQPDGQVIAMRFFHVSGESLASERRGVYCEECLAIANKMAKAQRNGF